MRRLSLLAAFALTCTISACSKDEPAKLDVYAAASLQETFTAIAEGFEKEHQGTDVVLNFGPSSGLATQIVDGAPADVFAAASTKTMDTVVKAGKGTDPAAFASNELTIAVPKANPAHVDALADLASAKVKVAICAKEVPCGAAAHTVFDKSKLTVKPVSEEVDVKAVLSKVRLGEVDAGLVYVTDAKAAGQEVSAVTIPAAENATTTYPIVALAGDQKDMAAKFIAYVQSETGQRIMRDAGFAAPN